MWRFEGATCAVFLFAVFLRAQGDPQEKTFLLCDPADPKNKCPGTDCACSETSIEVTFDGESGSVFQYESFLQDAQIDTTVVIDARTENLQSWSYGVTHDATFLDLLGVTIDGTAAEAAKNGGFAVADMNDIVNGPGYISAIILNLTKQVTLPAGRSKVCLAQYALKADAGPGGTLIYITDNLAKSGSPIASINLTEAGASKRPIRLVDGWVKAAGEAPLPQEKTFLHCDPGAPENQCPGEACTCSETSLEVTFDGESGSVFQYDRVRQDAAIETTVVIDARTDDLQGWSYGVTHDAAFLALLGVSLDDTAAEVAVDGGFAVADMNGIVNGPGYISAIVLSLKEKLSLPLGRSKVCLAQYALKADAGPGGTLIYITNKLAKSGSPNVALNLAEDGMPMRPGLLVDGWVKAAGEAPAENCSNGVDDDGDGSVDCADRDCAALPACVPAPEVCDNQKDDDLDGRIDCEDGDCAMATPCLPPAEVCDNGIDDDLDGRVDCEDGDCASFLACRRENCGNGQDDNGDGLADCADEDCRDAIRCRPEICDNGVDDNADAMADCHDDACREFPGCEPRPEICDNGEDEDFDGKIDCNDKDCMEAEACLPRPEICDNRQDDDRDGKTDCRDSDCAGAEACAPKPEVCDNCIDDDQDGKTDCRDSDCAEMPSCSPRPEICDNLLDDDGDGAIDGADPDCAVEPLPLDVCQPYALYFGSTVSSGDHAIEDGAFSISMRNSSPVLAFRLCVERAITGGSAVYELSDGLAGEDTEEPRSGGLMVLNDWRSQQSPATPNRALGLPGEVIGWIERGPALESLAPWDFLSTEIPDGPEEVSGLTVDYVADLNFWGSRSVIPPTPPGDPCSVNEILRIHMTRRNVDFLRGDLDGVEGISITDAINILNLLLRGEQPTLDCEAAFDVDDDGKVNITDPIVLLRFLFQAGPEPAEPFDACGGRTSVEELSLTCLESNCPP